MNEYLQTVFAPKHFAPSIEEFAALQTEVRDLRTDIGSLHRSLSDHAAGITKKECETAKHAFETFWLLNYFPEKNKRRTHAEIDSLLNLIVEHLGVRVETQPATPATPVLVPVKKGRRK